MDQLVCVIRKGTSYCLLQTGQIVLKFPQFDVQTSTPTRETNAIWNFDESFVVSLIQDKLSPDATFAGIVHIKTSLLPITRKRLFAFYVLIDIQTNVNATDEGDWLWQTAKNLQQKCDNGQFTESDLEIIRRIESHRFGANLASVNYEKVCITWTQAEIIECLTERENKLRLAAKYDEKAFTLFSQAFVEFTFPQEYLSLEQFEKFLIKIGIPNDTTKCQRLFRSFDERKERRLNFVNFVLGCAALEPHTNHGCEPGEMRCRYIFRYYCQKPDFSMALGEFDKMIDDIYSFKYPSANKNMRKKEIDDHYCGSFTMSKFLEKVGSLQLRGTSSLFRASFSIVEKLKYFYEPDVNVQPKEKEEDKKEKPEQSKPVISRPETNEACEQCELLKPENSSTYVLSKHSMQITQCGRVVELITNINSGCSSTLRNSGLSRESFNSMEFTEIAKEILRGVDYFQKPYIENERKKHAFSWGKVDLTNLAEGILTVCTAAYKLFSGEKRCLEIDDPVYVLGDIHGNLSDLLVFEERLWPLGPEFCPAKILFLGDYVDRGQYSIETVLYLFAHKILSPSRIFLLRGNHEIRSTYETSSFHKDCIDRFPGSYGQNVFEAINHCFDVLPIAAVVNKKVFCVHGGIPPPHLIKNDLIGTINKIPSPINFDDKTSELAWELMWNDPVWEDLTVALDREGFGPNERRETGHVFSSYALQRFLQCHSLSHVVRAHQIQTNGFQVRYNTKLLTVFSSSSYCGMDNEAACVLLERGRMRLIQIGKDIPNGKLDLRLMD